MLVGVEEPVYFTPMIDNQKCIEAKSANQNTQTKKNQTKQVRGTTKANHGQ